MKYFIILVLVLLGCASPSQHDPAVYGTFTVCVETMPLSFSDVELDALRDALDALDALGPDFVFEATCRSLTDVKVVRYFSPDCNVEAGSYTRGESVVYVDPDCLMSLYMLRSTFGHEVMHWYTGRVGGWIGHICYDMESRNDPGLMCHEDIFGAALLNPVASSNYHPTALDLQLIRTLVP